MTDHVSVERRGPRLAIRLERPEARNAITVAMYAALADGIEGAAADPSIRLITLEGAGVDFTAGNDLADFLQLRPDAAEELPVHRLLRALALNQIPLAAAVHGNAVGIGTTLLFHCDLVMAEEGCRFVMPFVDLGLVPEAASSLIFPRLAGRRAAARHLLLGEPFGAEDAERMGLVSHRVAAGELEERFGQLCATLLAKPPEALRLTQNLLRSSPADEMLARMERENEYFGDRLQSDEVKQAITAFFARRR